MSDKNGVFHDNDAENHASEELSCHKDRREAKEGVAELRGIMKVLLNTSSEVLKRFRLQFNLRETDLRRSNARADIFEKLRRLSCSSNYFTKSVHYAKCKCAFPNFFAFEEFHIVVSKK